MSTLSLFKYVTFKDHNRLLKPNGIVAKQYVVATLIRNAHLCLYDGITADYYNYQAPSLEDYFGVPQE